LAIALTPRLALAQPPAAAPAPSAAFLDQAKELIKSGQLDQTIELLEGNRPRVQQDPELLAQTYLLLIKAYTFIGMNLSKQEQGRSASEASFDKANSLTVECLTNKALRHTRPDSANYPPLMLQDFQTVRERVQGGLRVTTLEPPSAHVVLDGDTLRADSTGILVAKDLPAGTYPLVIAAPGYVTKNTTLQVTAGSTVERPYELKRHRGGWWYATRIGVASAAVAAVVIALPSHSSSGEKPLDTPPPPPSGHRQ